MSARLAGPIFESNTEVVLILLLGVVLLVGSVGLTIFGSIRAASRGDWLWLAAILGGWLMALGWAVAIVYLITSRRPPQVAASAEFLAHAYCTTCGSPAARGTNFCVRCGGPVKAQTRRSFR